MKYVEINLPRIPTGTGKRNRLANGHGYAIIGVFVMEGDFVCPGRPKPKNAP